MRTSSPSRSSTSSTGTSRSSTSGPIPEVVRAGALPHACTGVAWQRWQRSAFVRVRWSVRSPSRFRSIMRRQRTAANSREPPPRIDKLGVTGSSPVPPTTETPAHAGVSLSQEATRRKPWPQNVRILAKQVRSVRHVAPARWGCQFMGLVDATLSEPCLSNGTCRSGVFPDIRVPQFAAVRPPPAPKCIRRPRSRDTG
jgi:hypothetical protein